jgi:anti-sigma B factor antagonist
MKARRRDGVVILETSGRVTLGEGSSTLRRTIRELAQNGSTHIVLDMAEVDYMDSSGLGELMASRTTVLSFGGRLKLLSVSPRVRELLAVMHIDSIFEVFDDEKLAVESFSSGILDEQPRSFWERFRSR